MSTVPQLLDKLLGLFRRKPARPRTASGRSPAQVRETARPTATEPEEESAPAPRGTGELDSAGTRRARLSGAEEELLRDIAERIESGRFELPQLPSTSVAVMRMADDPRVEISEIADLIEGDPLLSSQLVQAANSALHGGIEPLSSIRDGVMRLGLRALRTLLLSASMRGIVLRSGALAGCADMVWRQSLSVASIARTIAPHARFDPETAFLLGLLHDVGKFPLLTLLSERAGRGDLSTALIGKVFHRFHEPMGSALSEKWSLGDELASVTGNHHAFRTNEDFPRSAALVALAHRLDLHLSLRDEAGFRALTESPEMDALEVASEVRYTVLELARTAYSKESARKAA